MRCDHIRLGISVYHFISESVLGNIPTVTLTDPGSKLCMYV
jgi:hypothetical protein